MDLLVLNNPIKAVGSINRICAALKAKYSECTERPFCESRSLAISCRLKGVQPRSNFSAQEAQLCLPERGPRTKPALPLTCYV